MYLNVYLVSRHYGGPEEGGWWYNAGTPLASVPLCADEYETRVERWSGVERTREVLTEAGEAKRDELLAMFKDHEWGSLSSVNGGEKVSVIFEENFAQPWPSERPYYC